VKIRNLLKGRLKSNCIKVVFLKFITLYIPAVVNPLTVAFGKSGKPRLVLDCRHINPHLVKFKFKYEDVSVASNIIKKGDFDLKSAYHIIEIFQNHSEYLDFSWENEGERHFYIYNVLPFGISTAGFIFTKLMRIPVRHVRSRGQKLVMFYMTVWADTMILALQNLLVFMYMSCY
jgi:hypothetical protein